MACSSEDEDDGVYMSTETDTSTATTATAASRKRWAKNYSSDTGKERKTRKTISAEERKDAYLQAKTELIRN
jgi:hypothetical protein